MTDFNPNQALLILAAAADEHRQQIEDQPSQDEHSDDESEQTSISPIYDNFQTIVTTDAVLKMCGFTVTEFDKIFLSVSGEFGERWNKGRGKKSQFTAKDALFMTITVLKQGGSWDFLSVQFNCKTSTFESTVMKVIKMVTKDLYYLNVQLNDEYYTMRHLHDQKTVFKYHPYTYYATDVCFQQSNRPTGNDSENKSHFSGKHKLYGYKTEMSCLPNGQCINVSNHAKGAAADITIFRQNRESFHDVHLSKSDHEINVVSQLISEEEVSESSWGVLLDKAYQGVDEEIRSLVPKKKPKNGSLTSQERIKNREISHDRIIIENFFGRMKSLYGVMSRKWRWDESSYDIIVRLCVSLTNIHINWHPLRADDGTFYTKCETHLVDVGESLKRRRIDVQRKYLEKRRRRLREGRTRVFDD